MTDAVEPPKRSMRERLFSDRRMVVMLLLGIASGLPFAVITGTLNAWFTEYKISIATIGVFAWAGLAYSFKFLWSPALHRTPAPFFGKMGLRRSWFIPIQIAIALCFLGFSLLNPADHFAFIAIIAVVGAFLSATFDIVVDAWRIETATSSEDLDSLTTFYQGGYRSAAFVGGAGALLGVSGRSAQGRFSVAVGPHRCTFLHALQHSGGDEVVLHRYRWARSGPITRTCSCKQGDNHVG